MTSTMPPSAQPLFDDLDRVAEQLRELIGRVDQIRAQVKKDLPPVAAAVVDPVLAGFGDLLTQAVGIAVRLIKNHTAIGKIFANAVEWQSVKTLSNTIAGQIRRDALHHNVDAKGAQIVPSWSGDVAEIYDRNLAAQAAAVAQFEKVAKEAAASLGMAGGVGLTFYAAIVAMLWRLVGMLGGPITQIGMAVGKLIADLVTLKSGAGAVLATVRFAGKIIMVPLKVFKDAVILLGQAFTAILFFVAGKAVSANQATVLRGLAAEQTGLIGGNWPNPATLDGPGWPTYPVGVGGTKSLLLNGNTFTIDNLIQP